MRPAGDGMSISLGVGLTSDCPFSCRHCYSGAGRDPVHMDPETLFAFIDALDVDSVNLGTGESCLHPGFHSVLQRFHGLGIPVAITTAGPSVAALSDAELAAIHDIDFSLDFPERERHDDWRAPGAFDMVVEGIERCRSVGVTASVAMCLMEQNAAGMAGMCRLCQDLGVSLRVNVYKPLHTSEYQPGYESFWDAVETLFSLSSRAISSEPVVSAALAAAGADGSVIRTGGSPCGKGSLRLRPGGTVLPCVYWDDSPVTMEGFLAGRTVEFPSCDLPVPDECGECPYLEICAGGCSGRRLYTGTRRADIYCFLQEGRRTPGLTVPEPLAGDSYIHASYLCTMIAEFD